MNTPMETRGLNSRTPSPSTSSQASSLLPMSMTRLRAEFSSFSRNLDLAPIKYKLIQQEGWTLERANAVEPQYKAFLFLIGSGVRAEFVPTFDVDEMWHTHILDTRKYMMDCARHFGEYIHHYPYLGMKDENDRSRAENLFVSTCAIISDAFDIRVGELDASSCGSGCGHGCGGHGCSAGHSCGGGGSGEHGHTDHGPGTGHGSHDDSASSCSATNGGDAQPKRRESSIPPAPVDSAEKPGIWRRIFGLSPSDESAEWYASVTPAFFNQNEFRPSTEDLDTSAMTVN